ncbi:FAD binding domain-containing protein [Cladophialophora immunda]|nr:FAD binding domain-containing protein [Cladophialophora immunda]
MGDCQNEEDVSQQLLSRHKEAVSAVSDRIASFHARRIPFRIFHGNTNSTRLSERTRGATVDISKLENVISVSSSKRTCLVEPNVPMDRLVAATLKHGLVPPVVPEFPGITVGGGFAGTAGESSSFKYGFFDKSVIWFEVVLADGKVVTASATERADLFYGMAGTFGTLGVITLFEMRLIPAKEFVELSYIRVGGIERAQEVIKQVTKRGDADFLDGIMFAPEKGVILVGQLAERDEKNKDLPVVTFTKPWDQWFYLHAEEKMNDTDATTPLSPSPSSPSASAPRDLIPLTDYLFRYDRGAFWTGRFAYTYFCIPFTRTIRWLADYFMHTRIMYHALHRSGLYQRFIIQDMALPNKNIPEFSRWLDEELPHIYPRWLCPLKDGDSVSMNPHLRNRTSSNAESSPASDPDPKSKEGDGFDNALLNIGVWGETPPTTLHVTINRLIEAKLKSLGGMKWLYAQTFYTEDEFWAIYDKRWYDDLRTKYQADGHIPSVFEKVRTKDIFELDGEGQVLRDARMPVEKGVWRIWPVAGVYGALSALKGGDYLRKR